MPQFETEQMFLESLCRQSKLSQKTKVVEKVRIVETVVPEPAIKQESIQASIAKMQKKLAFGKPPKKEDSEEIRETLDLNTILSKLESVLNHI
jgi:hypothetical protein